MSDLYTKEDHLMHLLSGGDKRIEGSHVTRLGPVSTIPVNYPIEFLRVVRSISDRLNYYVPTEDCVMTAICSGMLDNTKAYWYRSGLLEFQTTCHNNKEAYVALIRVGQDE